MLSLVLLICCSSISVSCILVPWYISHEQTWGADLIGFQEWMAPSKDKLYGYSDWMDWKGADGYRLRPYIDVNEIPNDFSGKFRILVDCQKFYVSFNDDNFTTFSFYHYCSPNGDDVFKQSSSELRVKKITKVTDSTYVFYSNFLEYRWGEFKSGYFASNAKMENRAVVVIEKVLDENSKIKYTVTVNGNELFSGILHTISPQTLVLESDLPKWFPVRIREISGLTKDTESSMYYGDISLWLLDTHLPLYDNKMGLKFEFNSKYGSVLCDIDGIENLTFDDASRTAKFYLKGRAEYGTVDYVVLKVMNESPLGQDGRENKFGLYTRKGALTFYKENPNGEDIVVKHFDENHTEFSVRREF